MTTSSGGGVLGAGNIAGSSISNPGSKLKSVSTGIQLSAGAMRSTQGSENAGRRFPE
jgi:hypothetical protein